MNSKLTLVLGASENPARYSYLAVNRLQQQQHPVVAIGRKPGMIGTTPVQTGLPALEGVDTVTLYLNPELQKQYYDYIVSLHPRRIIFNPGTENEELYNIAKNNNIIPQEACTLVLLASGQY
ncbi:MAG: CoA-binding protein [Ferruginibacter sp.]